MFEESFDNHKIIISNKEKENNYNNNYNNNNYNSYSDYNNKDNKDNKRSISNISNNKDNNKDNKDNNKDKENDCSSNKSISQLTSHNSFKERIIISKRDYYLFSIGFSLSVVPVVGIFTFSSAVFSLHTGGIGNALFCLGYTLCSLFYTRSIINSLGCKSSILWAHLGSILFVVLYLICITLAFSYSSIIYPIGAFIGGISQSIMWVAQGKYFAITTHFFISSMNVSEIEKTHREMAFLFHQTYLVNLVIGFTIIAISFVLTYTLKTSTAFLFVPFYGVYVSTSSYLLYFMNPIGDTGNINLTIWNGKRSFSNVLNSISKMSSTRKWKTIYLLPYHISWGLIHSLWVYYILGLLIGDTHFELGGLALLNTIITFLYAIFDKKYLSPLSSSSSSSSNNYKNNKKKHKVTLSSLSPSPSSSSSSSSRVNNSICNSFLSSNHLFPLILGAFGYILIGILLLFVDIDYKRSSSLWILTLITVLHGFIRSICENNMIATLADYFPQKETTTYLVMGTVKTITCGICFLSFGLTDPRHMNKRIYGYIIVIFGVLSLLGCIRAEILTQIERIIENTDNYIVNEVNFGIEGVGDNNNNNNNNNNGGKGILMWIRNELTSKFSNDSNSERNESIENNSLRKSNNHSISTSLRSSSQPSGISNNGLGGRVLTTDLSSPVGAAVLKGISLPGDQPISITSPIFGYPTPIPPLPDSLRLVSKDSSETESVIYVPEYF